MYMYITLGNENNVQKNNNYSIRVQLSTISNY